MKVTASGANAISFSVNRHRICRKRGIFGVIAPIFRAFIAASGMIVTGFHMFRALSDTIAAFIGATAASFWAIAARFRIAAGRSNQFPA